MDVDTDMRHSRAARRGEGERVVGTRGAGDGIVCVGAAGPNGRDGMELDGGVADATTAFLTIGRHIGPPTTEVEAGRCASDDYMHAVRYARVRKPCERRRSYFFAAGFFGGVFFGAAFFAGAAEAFALGAALGLASPDGL